MTQLVPFASVSDDELHTTVRRLTARSNGVLADLLARLGEVELRGIHRTRACASLYMYCIYELRMSEDAAFRRAKAARLVREHPEVRDLIAKGELHLTGLLMIGPYLGGERHAEILQRARFRSKSEIARLIARIDPKPEVPSLVEPIGPAPPGLVTHREFVESLSGHVRTLPLGQRPGDWIEQGDSGPDGVEDTTTLDQAPEATQSDHAGEPERALRYKVQFTASQEYVDLVNEAFDLLGHEMPRPDLPDLQLRAMRELVKQLKRRKRAATEQPRSPDLAKEAAAATGETAPAPEYTAGAAPAREQKAGTAPARHIPSAVRRAVWVRDGEQCAYVDGRGYRCRETRGLELHHCLAFALGGPSTFENLEVRCKAHNALAADGDFGQEHMCRARGEQHAR